MSKLLKRLRAGFFGTEEASLEADALPSRLHIADQRVLDGNRRAAASVSGTTRSACPLEAQSDPSAHTAHPAQPRLHAPLRSGEASVRGGVRRAASHHPLQAPPGSCEGSAVLVSAAAPRPAAALPGASGPPAAAAEEARRPPELRCSSLPQPLAGHGLQPAASGSGPGAPVSPDLAAPPPVLRRVSSASQSLHPNGLGASGQLSLDSMDSTASALTRSGTPAEQLAEAEVAAAAAAAAPSRDGSQHSKASAISCSAGATIGGVARDSQQPALPAAAASAKQHQGGAAGPAGMPCTASSGRRRSVSPPPAMRGHPVLGAQPAAQQGRTQSAAPQPSEPSTRLSLGASLFAAQQPPGASPLPSGPDGSSSEQAAAATPTSVSLLTSELRQSGASSAATSRAPSREVSVRSGRRQPGGLTLALSRESSIRGGQSRTRESSVRGGLSMALSRENSSRGGQGQCRTRESSVRDGSARGASARGGQSAAGIYWDSRVDLQRSPRPAPGAGGTYRGLVVAQRRPDQAQGFLEAFGGCGSGDWMGLPRGPGAQPAALQHAAMDPFSTEQPSMAALSAALAAAEEVEDPLDSPPLIILPQDVRKVGSWADRVTTFTHTRPEPHSEPPAPQHGGLDPLLLTAALEALAAAPPGNVLVGDSELAVRISTDLGYADEADHQALQLPPRAEGSWPPACSGSSSSGDARATAAALSCSWDAGCRAASHHLAPLVQLGGSAPTKGCSPLMPTAHGSGALPRLCPGSEPLQPLASELSAAEQDWNRSFMRRWRAVKKRAYLQALGLRALWRVNSLSDRHEPLELLTNDLPQCDNGMRRAWSVSRLAAQREEAARQQRRAGQAPSSEALPAMHRPSGSAIHKDPSLGTLLLGEVAEVC